MLREIARVNRPAIFGQVRQTYANNLRQLGDLACDERRIAELPNSERDVDIVVNKIGDAITRRLAAHTREPLGPQYETSVHSAFRPRAAGSVSSTELTDEISFECHPRVRLDGISGCADRVFHAGGPG